MIKHMVPHKNRENRTNSCQNKNNMTRHWFMLCHTWTKHVPHSTTNIRSKQRLNY